MYLNKNFQKFWDSFLEGNSQTTSILLKFQFFVIPVSIYNNDI
jgi:hypothetical protein